jgi:hypothetical protein
MTDLKDAKRLIAYARKVGAKSLRWGDLEIEFHAPGVIPPRQRGSVDASAKGSEPTPLTAPEAPPTLDQINEYIYGKSHNSDEPLEPH